MIEEKGNVFGSYKSEMQNIMDEFNKSAKGVFHVESRVLIEAEGPRDLPTKGLIIEHIGNSDKFEEHFEQYLENIRKLAHKLDKRTRLYQYPFINEFACIDKWVDYNGTKVAYNYSL